jgi:hypothetical protein
MGGRHKYNGVLPGAPRGSFSTLAIYHPSAMQPSARCLKPRLRWFGPVKNKTLTSLQEQSCTFGGLGVSQVSSGSATFANRAIAAKENRTNKLPLEVVLNHPSFQPLHVGWLNRLEC